MKVSKRAAGGGVRYRSLGDGSGEGVAKYSSCIRKSPVSKGQDIAITSPYPKRVSFTLRWQSIYPENKMLFVTKM